MRSKTLAVTFLATVWGCADAAPPPVVLEQEQDDHAAVVLEGPEISERLDQDLVSQVLTAPGIFTRLALMWDAPSSGSLELRTRLEGAAWSDWQPPLETFAEEGIFSGHVDAPEGGQQFQYRVVDGDAMPTWIDVVPLETIPAESGEAPPAADEEEAEIESSAEAAASGDFHIHSRASWNARAPLCVSSTVPNRVTIHHTVTPTNDSMSPQARLRQIQAFHMYSMGWCDIGYNFLVSRDGRVWRGRGRNRLGAHVANHNSGNVGISFMGNYSNVKANQEQRCGAADLLRFLHQKVPAIHLTRDDIKGHRQYAATACPGDELYGQLGAIVNLAKNGGCD
jgi:hypothetical protein